MLISVCAKLTSGGDQSPPQVCVLVECGVVAQSSPGDQANLGLHVSLSLITVYLGLLIYSLAVS